MSSNGRHEGYGVTYAVESSSLSSFFGLSSPRRSESKKPPMELELAATIGLTLPLDCSKRNSKPGRGRPGSLEVLVGCARNGDARAYVYVRV